MRFLSSASFYAPPECAAFTVDGSSADAAPNLHGYLLPSSYASARRVADLFAHRPLPLVAYTTSALSALQSSEVDGGNVIATTPSLQHYVETVVGTLRALDSDIVAVV